MDICNLLKIINLTLHNNVLLYLYCTYYISYFVILESGWVRIQHWCMLQDTDLVQHLFWGPRPPGTGLTDRLVLGWLTAWYWVDWPPGTGLTDRLVLGWLTAWYWVDWPPGTGLTNYWTYRDFVLVSHPQCYSSLFQQFPLVLVSWPSAYLFFTHSPYLFNAALFSKNIYISDCSVYIYSLLLCVVC